MRYRARRGFTIPEVMAALGILGVVLVLVAQMAIWALQERRRIADRQAAQELAANVLESARTVSWDDLTAEWASRQRLPKAYAERGWTLKVEVASEKSRPKLKRMTAVVMWKSRAGGPARPIELVGLFAARSAETKGDKP